MFEWIYLPNAKRYQLPIFNSLYYTNSLRRIKFWSLAFAPRQYCNVRYPTGFKPAITLGRSNQIASNSVCRYRGPILIDLYCSLIFMPSVTEIQLNKVRPLFPLDSRQRFWQIASRSVYVEAVVISLARIEREKWTYFVQLYHRNGLHKN